MAMVEEVRRQFRTIPGIMEGTGKPEYDKCVAISTEASIKKMVLPGAIALISPLVIGFAFGPEVLGGFLAGATVSGVLMGMFQNNAGGAWDNAKKSFEKGVEINGQIYYKGSDPHKASVTGDTVGDPFKDTSGPSMNILIKLMSIISLVIAPTLATIYHTKDNVKTSQENLKIKIVQTNLKQNPEMENSQKENTPDNGLNKLADALRADNLIKNGNLTAELKDGIFSINGKKQSDEIIKKYQPYFNNKKDFNFSIEVNEK